MDNKKKSKENYIFKFLIIVLSFVIIYCIAGLFGIYFYLKFNHQPVYDPSKQTDIIIDNTNVMDQKNEEILNEKVQEKTVKKDIVKDDGFFASLLTPPERTNFLIAGVDKNENLTDCIIAGSFVSSNNEINIISIPRDTYVEIEPSKLKKMREVNRSAPSAMKINAVNVYGGKKYGMELLKSEVEEILDITIDYYIKVDLDAFKSIVDSVGGIYFDVPKGGLRYSDPGQNLYINLKGGYQLLDGKQAEGLVRFRKGYAQQDLHRVEVQQEFIKEFLKQVFAKENLRTNFGKLIATYIQYVDTDFSIEDIPKYLKCLNTLNTENITSATLPGYADMINGASYYIFDRKETSDIVDKYFYNTAIETETSSSETSSSETTTEDTEETEN